MDKFEQVWTNLNKFEQVWTSFDKFGQVCWTSLNKFRHDLPELETNWSNLLKIRKWSPEEEDQKTTPRSAIEDLADKIRTNVFYMVDS